MPEEIQEEVREIMPEEEVSTMREESPEPMQRVPLADFTRNLYPVDPGVRIFIQGPDGKFLNVEKPLHPTLKREKLLKLLQGHPEGVYTIQVRRPDSMRFTFPNKVHIFFDGQDIREHDGEPVKEEEPSSTAPPTQHIPPEMAMIQLMEKMMQRQMDPTLMTRHYDTMIQRQMEMMMKFMEIQEKMLLRSMTIMDQTLERMKRFLELSETQEEQGDQEEDEGLEGLLKAAMNLIRQGKADVLLDLIQSAEEDEESDET